MPAEHWQDDPEAHDFPAAADYLSLVAPAGEVSKVVDALKSAKTEHRKAKDLLRASRLSLLSADNVHVKKDLAKVDAGKALSPVLLVRGRGDKGIPLTVADGYHRICASHHLDEDADVPCRLVAWP
jgi:cellobiose-specific phosphotransferase system component IIA